MEKANPSTQFVQSSLGEEFAKNLYTKEKFVRRLGLLREFIFSQVFTSSQIEGRGDLKTRIKKFLISYQATDYDMEEEERQWLESLGEAFFNQFTPQNANEFFADLGYHIEHAPLVVLFLAYTTSERQQEEIGMWVKKNVGSAAMCELHVAPELIGGCTLSYKGFFKDYSLRSILESQKQKIVDQLKTVMHNT